MFNQVIYVIAPFYKQGVLFAKEMGWERGKGFDVRILIKEEHLLGQRFYGHEVWWLDRMWPCRTHSDVWRMEYMMRLARVNGADIRRWYT